MIWFCQARRCTCAVDVRGTGRAGFDKKLFAPHWFLTTPWCSLRTLFLQDFEAVVRFGVFVSSIGLPGGGAFHGRLADSHSRMASDGADMDCSFLSYENGLFDEGSAPLFSLCTT